MPRRLPLVAVPSPGGSRASADDAPRKREPAPRAIGLADTGDGALAVRFATDLAGALSALGLRVRVALLAHDATPVLTEPVRTPLEAVARHVSAHAIGSVPAPLDLLLPAPERETVDLLVGPPALSSYAPALTLLLAADRDALRWPEALRRLRGTFDVTLGEPRQGFAVALARALHERGFLPRG